MIVFSEPLEFEWDKGNRGKNLIKHGVSDEKCEEVFLDENKKFWKDLSHSEKEQRYVLLGKTKLGRPLYVVFTLRGNKIRVISARDLNKNELKLYEKEN